MKAAARDCHDQRWRRGEFEIDTDSSRIDVPFVHQFLRTSYWAKGIPLDVLRRALDNSLCFGIYEGPRQVGFARAITDHATFAYVADVFVIEVYRGRGLARWLMQCIKGHPDLQGLRRWALITRDAHGLYRHYGFMPLSNPQGWMEIHHPDVYR
jgi:GNAT superfamily N-acetyltransferase